VQHLAFARVISLVTADALVLYETTSPQILHLTLLCFFVCFSSRTKALLLLNGNIKRE